MNRLRCFLFGTILVISSATFALGGEIQGPGKSDPSPSPTPASALATDSTTDSATAPSTVTIQLAWQDLATVMLRELLLIVY
jgi:hypothetical protein